MTGWFLKGFGTKVIEGLFLVSSIVGCSTFLSLGKIDGS
jgi:hypothetical protein